MNTTVILKKLQSFGVLLLPILFSAWTFAQDNAAPANSNVNVTTTKTQTTTEQWVTNPVYWVIGALLFIILIAIIIRGGGKKD